MTNEVAEVRAGEIHGWGCTPTGEPPPSALLPAENPKPNCISVLFHRGWRRNALFGILTFLIILVFLNIALTLWIINCLNLSVAGIGPLKILNGGLQLSGKMWVVNSLISSTIASQPAQPLTLHSHRNFTVTVTDHNNTKRSSFLMKRNTVECGGKAFHVKDARGSTVFHASRDEVRVKADVFTVDNVGGLTVKNAVQSPIVKAPPGSDLTLESSTRRLDIRAPQSINLESRAGNIDISSYSDIKLHSVVGSINIDASNIVINNLKKANLTNLTNQKGTKNIRVYQLCACASGKLFLAAPDAICEALEGEEPCR